MEFRGVTAILLISILVVFVRLVQSGLQKPRNALFAFLGMRIAEEVVSLGVGPRTAVAFWAYIGFSLLRWALYLTITIQIYGAVFLDYPRIRAAINSSMRRLLPCIGLFSTAVAWATWQAHAHPSAYFELAQRTLPLAMILFVLAVFVLGSRYPMQVERNLLTSTLAFCSIVSLEALFLLVADLFLQKSVWQLNSALLLCEMVCYFAWAMSLRRSPIEFERLCLR